MSHPSFKYRLSTKRPLAVTGRNSGFTLVELMVAMGIMLIVLTAIISLFQDRHKLSHLFNSCRGFPYREKGCFPP